MTLAFKIVRRRNQYLREALVACSELTPATEFEKPLKSPAYSKADNATYESAGRFRSRVGHGAAAGQRVADDCEADRPDQDTKSHEAILADVEPQI